MFTLAAEWAEQQAVVLAWPNENTDWQPWLPDVQATYLQLISALTLTQQVILLLADSQQRQQCLQLLIPLCNQAQLASIHPVIMTYNDTWCRDYIALTLSDGQRSQCLDFQFNAWGDKFASYHDNLINKELVKSSILPSNLQTHDFVLEGGSVDSDGAGTILTSSACLLNINRNANLNKTQIEQKLLSYLHVQRVLWLDHGQLSGDDTDAHIDTLARFVNEQCIVFQGCQRADDAHYASLQAMHTQLSSFTTLQGRPYQLIELPLPSAIYNQQGVRLPASYANFLISNQRLFLPVYSVPEDQLAIEQLAQLDYEIVPINCRSLIEQFGSLHCITMQLPKHSLHPNFKLLAFGEHQL